MHKATALLVMAIVLGGVWSTEGRAEARGDDRPLTDGFRPEPVRQVLIEARLVGVTFDGEDFWLSQHGDGVVEPPMIHQVNQEGTILGSFEQTDAWVNGVHDIQFWNGRLWGSECYYLRGFGLDGTWPDSPYFLAGSPFSPSDVARALCHDPVHDRWFVGGHGTDVYSGAWDGTDGTTPPWTPITPGPLPGPSGMAYDPARDCLWLTDGITGTLHKLDPDGGPSLGQIPFLGSAFGKPRGCCIAEIQNPEPLIVLVAVMVDEEERTDDWLVMWDLEEIDAEATPVEPASWGRIKAFYR